MDTAAEHASKTLPFKVVPEFLEDLGVNLYTSLDKVLVEFLANAHDADATFAKISMSVAEIDSERKLLKAKWDAEREKALAKIPPDAVPPLESQTLPEEFKITIEDDGHGMSEEDLAKKFLQVSRRKRDDDGPRSPNGRVFMGRKGLGKLAGFGVAQRIVVTTQKQGEAKATRIVLDYSQIKQQKSMEAVAVPCETIDGAGEFTSDQGTRIELSRLVYAGLRGTQQTALRHAAECFWMVDLNDFAIWHSDKLVECEKRNYEWAYPIAAGKEHTELLEQSVSLAGHQYSIRYRIRFTPSKGQLKSHEHGVRIYAHNRLASVPYLFEVTSSSTGYKYTSYLDGVVVADFIDEQPTDYISTNRQTLRWETPLLSDLHTFIHDEIVKALKEYYATKEDTINDIVKKDLFTKKTIDAAKLPKHREKLAYNIAVVLAKADTDEVQSSFYQKSLPIVVHGLSRGDVLSAIAMLAKQQAPDLGEVVREITELTKQEFGDFLGIIQGRLDGITALRKINAEQDFSAPETEAELQKLFEINPWLIDPTFFQFLSANETQATLNRRLSKQLEIGPDVPAGYSPSDPGEKTKYGQNKRPDLAFALGNDSLRRYIIVELKSPNTPLHFDHLEQLKDYLRRTEDFLQTVRGLKEGQYDLRGILIGARAPQEDNNQEKVKKLRYEETKRDRGADWEVVEISTVLERTEAAHREILAAYEKATQAPKTAT